MKILIITAHPSKDGFTHKIAESYKKGAKKKGGEIEIIDLYDKKYQQAYLSFYKAGEFPKDPKRDLIQKKISEANELVFIHPMWWMSMPAVMKNFIDSNFTAGYAYSFSGGPVPKGLLKGRTAKVFMTCDGPAIYYFFHGQAYKKIWVKGLLNFCGIKVTDFILFDRMRLADEKKRVKRLKKVYRMASNT